MTKEKRERAGESLVERISEDINLPALLGGPAGKALARLVAGAVDYPAAWLDRWAQDVRDGTEARSLVSQALASSVAEQVKSDPDLVNRMAARWISTEAKRQINREKIAKLAAEELSESSVRNVPPEGSEAPRQREISEEWVDKFSTYAQDISDDDAQRRWAALLAGEIRTPGTIPYATFRVLAEITPEIASAFESVAGKRFGNSIITKEDGFDTNLLIDLENAGLIVGSGGLFNKRFKSLEDDANCIVLGESKDDGLCFEYDGPAPEVYFESYPLTPAGRAIYDIMAGSHEMVDSAIRHFPKDGLRRVALNVRGKSKKIFFERK